MANTKQKSAFKREAKKKVVVKGKTSTKKSNLIEVLKKMPRNIKVVEYVDGKKIDTRKVKTSPVWNINNRNLIPPVSLNDLVNHPSHYGGEDNIYEVIKVIRAWGVDKNFCLGNTLKYIARAGKKDPKSYLVDLKKAAWYLQDEINELEKNNKG